jgi:hypothetical protein
MSDLDQSAALSAAEEETVQPVDMLELARSGDIAALRAMDPDAQPAEEIAEPAPEGPVGEEPVGEEPVGEEPVGEEPAPAPAIDPTQGMTAAQAKAYRARYGDTEVELPDEDGFLGHKSVEGLKKKAANAHLHIQTLERENKAAREAADAAVQQQREYEEELARLRKAATQQPSPVASATPAEKKAVEAVAKVDLPSPPKRPTTPYDPGDMSVEQSEEWDRYFTQSEEYQTKLVEALRAGSAPANVDPATFEQEIERRVQERMSPMTAEVEKIKQSVSGWETEQKRKEAQRANDEMWRGFDDFQRNFEPFATPKPLREIHTELDAWSDKIAAAVGHKLPYGATAQMRDQYVNRRQAIVQAYLDGDAEITSRTQGIDPPEGYEQYYNIARINQIAQEHKLPLEDAMAVWLKKTGKLDGGMESLRVSSEQRGREAVGRAIADSNQFAKPIPNDVAQRSNQTGLPAETLEALAKTDPRDLVNDPDKLRQMREYGAKQGWDL